MSALRAENLRLKRRKEELAKELQAEVPAMEACSPPRAPTLLHFRGVGGGSAFLRGVSGFLRAAYCSVFSGRMDRDWGASGRLDGDQSISGRFHEGSQRHPSAQDLAEENAQLRRETAELAAAVAAKEAPVTETRAGVRSATGQS